MIFQEYSNYYNLLYSDKNYLNESDYILNTAKKYAVKDLVETKILDVGCGTGRHVAFLSNNFKNAIGIDPSKSMIKIAKFENNNSNLIFKIASGQNFKFKEKFDTIISLFHVFSYQTQDIELKKYLTNIYNHLQPKGVFIFDFWYEEAVLNLKPELRVKKIENEKIKITRISTPVHFPESKIINVNFDIFIQSKNKIKYLFESHKMKYFSLDEVKQILTEIGFKNLIFEEMITQKSPSANTWGVTCIAKK